MSDEPALLTGETIVWRGRPRTGLMLRPVDGLLIPFSLLWAALPTMNLLGVVGNKAAGGTDLFLVLFVLIGAYLTVGRFVHDSILRRSLGYFVTDRRILIVKRGRSSVRSLDIKRLPTIDLSERSDGSGTIRFGESGSIFGNGSASLWLPSASPIPQFLMIDDAWAVYELIQRHAD